jgi:succinate-semialdehyde dehydrogenase/glutarate-semialdehyde dehydrogenase
MAVESVNPASGEVLERFAETTPAEIEGILARAHAAFRDWRERPFAERAGRMRAAAGVLRERRARYARTMAVEMGKPLAQGEAEVEKCASACEYYGEHAEAFLAPEPRATDASRCNVRFDPRGPVRANMPLTSSTR